jgi:hypothetical protein
MKTIIFMAKSDALLWPQFQLTLAVFTPYLNPVRFFKLTSMPGIKNSVPQITVITEAGNSTCVLR